MKKLLIIALSVMVITGATAQQKTQQSAKVVTEGKAKAENNEVKANQGTSANAQINADDIKSTATQTKETLNQKINEQKGALTEKVTNVTENITPNREASLGSAIGIEAENGTVTAGTESAAVINAKSNVTDNMATATNQAQSAVKDVKTTVNSTVNKVIDVAPKVDAKVKTDVATQVDVKPVKVSTRITSGSGIKL